ncbi:MAG: class I SAM-dependent methyltransferase [Puniceicoccales bacterium]|jgi:ubiquinone/menaquinone biosynthesis C-methylase UbiE|nr:class I SAM-dependent methyltransferase [Puniceicoccales bacterium]
MKPPFATVSLPPSNVAYFAHPDTVLEYTRVAANTGLWESERLLCEQYFPKDRPLLELGCGAGRVALGLWENGWRHITAIDFSPPMIEAAREVALARNADVTFAVGNAVSLSFDAEQFQSVIFAFNGLMMIPSAAQREAALHETYRVLAKGGVMIFTGHERDTPRNAARWRAEQKRWEAGNRDRTLEKFGDRACMTDAGRMFIHVAAREETHALAERCGFEVLFCAMRSEICSEPATVHAFSDDTRFWVLRKNGN